MQNKKLDHAVSQLEAVTKVLEQYRLNAPRAYRNYNRQYAIAFLEAKKTEIENGKPVKASDEVAKQRALLAIDASSEEFFQCKLGIDLAIEESRNIRKIIDSCINPKNEVQTNDWKATETQ